MKVSYCILVSIALMFECSGFSTKDIQQQSTIEDRQSTNLSEQILPVAVIGFFTGLVSSLLFQPVGQPSSDVPGNSLNTLLWRINLLSVSQSWPALKTTFRKYTSQPRTASEAEAGGWKLIDKCSSSSNFLGQRYAHPDDNSIVLIFDVAGFIAGSQSVVPWDKVNSTAIDISRRPVYQV